MKRQEYFRRAMLAGEYKRIAWVISAFSLIREKDDDWKSNPYPFRLIQRSSGFFFVDPDNNNELSQIEDAVLDKPLFDMKEVVELKAGEVPNLSEDVRTLYGNLLFNWMCLVYPFGKKVPFQTGKLSPAYVNSLIVDRIQDNPENPDDRSDEVIYVDEYLKYTSAMFNLTAFTQLCVPTCTPKTITAPPGIKELREKLLAENKDHLKDPAVIARIDAQLVQYLRDWMKGDEGENFLISKKSYDVVRRKLYLMGGADPGLDDSLEADLVVKPYSEGWDPEKFPTMNTVSRAGSFNRGAQTELGGEAVKWLFRASSNMTITEDDCGSNMGVMITAKPGEERRLIGFTALIKSGNITVKTKITKENVGQYLGRAIMLRSSMFCKLDKTDFCKTCLGDRLSASPTGLSTAVAEYGSAFLGIFMSSMHATSLQLARLDYKAAIH